MSDPTDFAAHAGVSACTAIARIGVEIDAPAVAVGEFCLARKAAHAIVADHAWSTLIAAFATVVPVQGEVDTSAATVGEFSLAGGFAKSGCADCT